MKFLPLIVVVHSGRLGLYYNLCALRRDTLRTISNPIVSRRYDISTCESTLAEASENA